LRSDCGTKIEIIHPEKQEAMEAMLNPQNENQSASIENPSEKSELMQFFENQVHDIYWAYKDLLKEIFEKEE
jgi:hypothetical protein